MRSVTDLWENVARCRRLAREIPQSRVRQRLLELADEYEREALAIQDVADSPHRASMSRAASHAVQ